MPMQKMCNSLQQRSRPTTSITLDDDIIVIPDDEENDDRIEVISETSDKRSATPSPTPSTDQTVENPDASEVDCKVETKIIETEIKIEDVHESDFEDEITAESNPRLGNQDCDVVVISDSEDYIANGEVKTEEDEELEDGVDKARTFDSLDDNEKITLLCFYEVNCNDEIIDRTLVSSTFNCLLCRFKTDRERRLIEHVRVKHNRRKLQCAFCGFGTFHDAIMSEHFKYRHSGAGERHNGAGESSRSKAENCVLDNGKKQWDCKCDMCRDRLKNRQKLRRYRQKRAQKCVRCYLCEFKSTTKAVLRRHISKMHRKK